MTLVEMGLPERHALPLGKKGPTTLHCFLGRAIMGNKESTQTARFFLGRVVMTVANKARQRWGPVHESTECKCGYVQQ